MVWFCLFCYIVQLRFWNSKSKHYLILVQLKSNHTSGRWIKISTEPGETKDTLENHKNNLNCEIPLKDPFHFNHQGLWQVCLWLKDTSSLFRGTGTGPSIPGSGFPLKVQWHNNPVFYLKQQILWTASFNFHEESHSGHPARLRSNLWTSQGLAQWNRSQAHVYDAHEIGRVNEILSQSKLLFNFILFFLKLLCSCCLASLQTLIPVPVRHTPVSLMVFLKRLIKYWF